MFHPPDLSSREKEVLGLILDEYTTIEIAEILCLSKDTIKTYRNSLLRKLEARNVAGLVRKAYEAELVKVAIVG